VSKKYIEGIINQLLKDNKELIMMRKKVNEYDHYTKSKTTQQAQIAKRYGGGIHFLLPNTRGIGVGKSKSLCTLEEFNFTQITNIRY